RQAFEEVADAGRRRLLALDDLGHHVEPLVRNPVREGPTQGGGLHLLGGALRVVARLRAVDRAAAGVGGRTRRALSGAAGPLLAERLATAAPDLAAGLGGVRALARRGLLRDDDLVHQRHVGLDAEDLGGQLHRTVGLAGRGTDVELEVHGVLRRGHACAPHFTADRTTTRPPLRPGMAPLMRRTPASASTSWTLRFMVVTRSLPMRPAMDLPLNTRPGVAAPPMRPGLRCTACVPCEAPCPPKPWRFMVPAKPWPLEVPVPSTKAPSVNTSAPSSWPSSKPAACSALSSRSSTRWRRGVTPASENWPA